jgi:hypothetical protein
MIGFMYEGYFYCANVHTIIAREIEYRVNILTSKIREGIPETVVLHDTNTGLKLVSNEHIDPRLFETLVHEIEAKGV